MWDIKEFKPCSLIYTLVLTNCHERPKIAVLWDIFIFMTYLTETSILSGRQWLKLARTEF